MTNQLRGKLVIWTPRTQHLDGENGKDKSSQLALGHCWVARGFEAHGFTVVLQGTPTWLPQNYKD